MQAKNSIQYSFLEESFTYLVALNRGLTKEKDNRERVLESSFIRLSRLLFYAHLPNKFARVDHELHFVGFYLEQQSLRYQGRLQYRIESDYMSIHWAVRKLELYRLLDKLIMESMEASQCDLSIHIDAMTLNSNKEMIVCIHQNTKTYERKLKVRKMRPDDSRFYMLDFPILSL